MTRRENEWRQPNRRAITRWYMVISLLAFVCPIAIFGSGCFYSAMAPYSSASLIGLYAAMGAAGLWCLGIFWSLYFAVWFHSGDRFIVWKQKPKVFAAGFGSTVVVLPVILGGTSFAIMIATIALNRYAPANHSVDIQVIRVSGTLFAIGLVWYVISLPYGWKLKSRVRENAIARRVCFECGYDLHACVTPTCPECGEAIPWLAVGAGDD